MSDIDGELTESEFAFYESARDALRKASAFTQLLATDLSPKIQNIKTNNDFECAP